jgi:hypothetical protein
MYNLVSLKNYYLIQKEKRENKNGLIFHPIRMNFNPF